MFVGDHGARLIDATCTSPEPNATSTSACRTATHQPTVIAQVGAGGLRRHAPFGFYYLQVVTALILVLAANTAFNGFPVLASILAQDGYLPRQLHTRGDRLVVQQRHPAAGRLRGRC